MYPQTLKAEIDAACGDFSKLTVQCDAKLLQMETVAGTYNG